MLDGIGRQIALAMAGKKNPWGGGSGDGEPPAPGGSSGGNEPPQDKPRGPRNPWLPPAGGDGERRGPNLDDILRGRGPEGPRRGGGGGPPNFRLPPRANGKSWLPIAIGALVVAWLALTSLHQIQAKEQGIVTWLGGKYSRPMTSGLNFTLPWPIQQVAVENVSEIRAISIGNEGQNLILTGDQNLVDLSYIVRWKIKDLAQFTYQLDNPVASLREVGEAAMRASVAEQELDAVVSGEGRAEIEASVQRRMQATLDAYRSGIVIEGAAIVRADPPEKTIEAFKEVSAAQQQANAMRNRARAYAQQVLARAQGDAAAFDQIYAQYKLAPEVTRRRMYYETMESVLGKVDKTIVETGGVTSYLPLPEIKRTQKAEQPTTTVEGQ